LDEANACRPARGQSAHGHCGSRADFWGAHSRSPETQHARPRVRQPNQPIGSVPPALPIRGATKPVTQHDWKEE
jgi:hypothetical protein